MARVVPTHCQTEVIAHTALIRQSPRLKWPRAPRTPTALCDGPAEAPQGAPWHGRKSGCGGAVSDIYVLRKGIAFGTASCQRDSGT